MELPAETRAVMRREGSYAHCPVGLDMDVSKLSRLPRPSCLRPHLNFGIRIASESFAHPGRFSESTSVGIEKHLEGTPSLLVLVRVHSTSAAAKRVRRQHVPIQAASPQPLQLEDDSEE